MPDIGYAIVALMSLLVFSSIGGVFHRKKTIQLAASSLILVALAAVSACALYLQDSYSVLGALLINPFSMLFVLLFSFTLLLINLLSYDRSSDYPSFSLLFSFVVVGALVVAMANSIVTIVLGIELTVLPTAFMIIINGKNFVEPAVKLFIMSAVSVSMLVFAVILIYPYDPALSLMGYIANPGIAGSYLVMLSLLLFIAGISFDAALFPFNMWIPDVYQGAPANITALLSGVNKKVAFVAMLEILFVLLLHLSPIFSVMIQALAVITMFFGNIVALVQNEVKRLFAYSSISQAGYIAIGIAAASQLGVESSMFYLFAHAFMIIGAFAIILWLESNNVRSIQEYRGLASRNRWAALCLTVFMLSLIGIPPFIGFIGKFLLFSSAISANLVWLAAIGVINSIISVYYYAKVIISMYSGIEKTPLKMGTSIGIVVIICLIAVVAIGLYPGPLISAVSTASNTLIAM